MTKINKVETIEEFLARGGKITVFPPDASSKDAKPFPTINPTQGGPAVIMTYGEADLYYGEGRPKKARKKKAQASIDLSALPEAIRNKYCKGLTDDEV